MTQIINQETNTIEFLQRKKIEIKVIMDCRKTSLHKFRTKLRFRQYDVILAKDKSVLTKIKSYFEREICKHNIMF